jgi:hypothetical protein
VRWLSQIEDKEAEKRRGLERVAHHEAGHAVACVWLGLPFRWVSIKPKGDSQGRVSGPSPLARLLEKHEDGDALTPREWVRVENEVVSFCAGSAAEAEYLRRNNLVSIENLAVLVEVGEPDRSMNVGIATRLHGDDPDVAHAWLTYLRLRAVSLVRWHWTHVEHVAEALVNRRTLSAKDVRAVISESFKPELGSIFYTPDDT